MKLGAGLILLALITASPDIKYFRYERPVLNTPQRSSQTCLVMDPGIFTHAAAQLADLRLYRDNTETPYVVRMAAPVQYAENSIPPLNLGARGGQTVFDAAMPDGKYSDIQLAVTAQDFIATVTVSGSQAQTGSSETKLGAYTIFDLTKQRLGRSTILHLPESDFRYLHFRITGPLRLESIPGLTAGHVSAGQAKYVTVAESSQVTQKGHSSVIEFTVPAHVPVDQIAFTPGTEPALFSRDVTISVAPVPHVPETDAAEPPQPITSSGNILRIHSVQDRHRIDEENLVVSSPGTDFDTPAKWTVTIDNGDDTPLAVESVRLQMVERSLCFEAAADVHYALYYGDAALVIPHYDYAKLFTPESDASQAMMGPEQQNPTYQSRPDERSFTEKHPGLLWAALVAVIGLLGVIALRSVTQTAGTP